MITQIFLPYSLVFLTSFCSSNLLIHTSSNMTCSPMFLFMQSTKHSTPCICQLSGAVVISTVWRAKYNSINHSHCYIFSNRTIKVHLLDQRGWRLIVLLLKM